MGSYHQGSPEKRSISLRTLLLGTSAIAVFCAIFVGGYELDERYYSLAPVIALVALMALLIAVTATFASAGEDLCQDPGAVFVAGLAGFLGFVAVLMTGFMGSVFF